MKAKFTTRIAAFLAAASVAAGAAAIPASARYNISGTSQVEAFSRPYQAFWAYLEQMKFPAGKYWNGGNPNSYTNTPCNGHANDNYYRHKNIYTNGYTSKIGSVNGYQCYGFAQKLQSDFYGVDGVDGGAWIRFTNPAGLAIRPGDHIRIGNNQHSVFVTEVDLSTNQLKIADCNAGGTCVIRWNVDASVSGNTFYLQGYAYRLYWIERPVMAGDTNGDSAVTAIDISNIRKIALGTFDFTGKQKAVIKEAADINNDGAVTVIDWVLASNEYAGRGYIDSERFLTNVGSWS